MDQKVSLIYFSATGNTKKVLQGIARTITEEYKEYDITMEEDRTEDLIPAFGTKDLVMIGVPVYAGRVPKFLVDYLKRVKGSGAQAAFVVNYGNREYEDALIELQDIFEGNGFVGVAGAAFLGEHSYTSLVATNRPDELDMEKAAAFGRSIEEKLKNATEQEKHLSLKGNRPYVEKGMVLPPTAPTTNSDCVACGLCAASCPTGAIAAGDYGKSDGEKCILCCRCIKNCPVKARSMEADWVKNITKILISNCAEVRKEPELFL